MRADSLTVYIPGTPHAKERARSRVIRSNKTGRAIASHYTPSKTRQKESIIRTYAISAMKARAPFAGPVRAVVSAFFEPPASWPKWKREAALKGYIAHTGKPDADNVAKSAKDALNGVAWVDDSQCVELMVSKRYGEAPGTEIFVRELPGLNTKAIKADYEAHVAEIHKCVAPSPIDFDFTDNSKTDREIEQFFSKARESILRKTAGA